MGMVKCRVLVPVCANPGDEGEGTYGAARTYTLAHHERFERRALELFGGFTREASVHGAWVDEGVTYSDESIPYTLSIPSILDTSRVRQFCEYAARHYRQRAIYVEVGGFAEVFVPDWRASGQAPTKARGAAA